MPTNAQELTFELGKKRYLLTFNNAGRRAAEDTLGMEWPEIGEKINESGPGYRIQTGLLFGATRKYHRRDVPNMAAVDAIMDRIEDSDEETLTDFVATLMALFFRGKKDVWLKIITGEELDEEEAEESPEAEDEAEDSDEGVAELPKAPAKRSTKPSGSRTRGGTNSS